MVTGVPESFFLVTQMSDILATFSDQPYASGLAVHFSVSGQVTIMVDGEPDISMSPGHAVALAVALIAAAKDASQALIDDLAEVDNGTR